MRFFNLAKLFRHTFVLLLACLVLLFTVQTPVHAQTYSNVDTSGNLTLLSQSLTSPSKVFDELIPDSEKASPIDDPPIDSPVPTAGTFCCKSCSGGTEGKPVECAGCLEGKCDVRRIVDGKRLDVDCTAITILNTEKQALTCY